MRRTLSLLLVLALCLSLISIQAFAGEEYAATTDGEALSAIAEETVKTEDALDTAEADNDTEIPEPEDAEVSAENAEPASDAEEDDSTTDSDTTLVASGTCGTNLTWELDSDGTLTISGSGMMSSFSSGSAPWADYLNAIITVSIEEGVTYIWSYAFSGCTNLQSANIPDSVTSIGACLFENCTSLIDVTIGSGLTVLNGYTFYGCTSLQSITIPNNITTLSTYAFYRCTALEEVALSSNLTSIGTGAFYGCTSLIGITIPDSVTSISDYAFRGCTSLQEITIPSSVTSIGTGAFYGCSKLTAIYVAEGNSSYCVENGMLYSVDMTELVLVPAGMKSVIVPEGVTSIDDYAFYNCTTLIMVQLPASVASIGYGAFGSCSSLYEVYYTGTEDDWAEITVGSYNTYLTAATIYYNSTGTALCCIEISTLNLTGTGIELCWNADSNAEGYYIYRMESAEEDYQLIATVTGGTTDSYVDTNVESGCTYYYYVQAYSETNTSQYTTGKWIVYLDEFVTEETDLTPQATSNVGDQSYTVYYATQPYSYLVAVDGGYMRVEYTSSKVVVEYYDENYNLTAKKYVAVELSIFGGFYADEDAYYLVFGQKNSSEDDNVEVVRVVKYSTDWIRQGEASLYGANTTIPFNAGSCRMTAYNGYLYVRTCHTMYASSDGLNHQANLTIEVDTDTMTVTDSYYIVMNNSVGYVSHSFNQFILVDDEANLIALDHGDAYPRAAILFQYATKAGNSTFSGRTNYVNLYSFEGDTGTNKTGASLGGLEYSSTSYLVAGNSVDQDDDWSSHTARNVFVAVTSRDDFSSDGTTVKWITDYDTDGSITASTPQLVKLDSDAFLLLWTTVENSETKLHYVYLDGEGNTTTEIYTVNGRLSDCQPIVSDGTVIWYVTGDTSTGYTSTAPFFYMISADGTFSVHSDLAAPSITGISITTSGIEVTWDAVDGAEGYYVYYRTVGSSSYKKVTINDGETTSTTISSSALTGGTSYEIWMEAYSGTVRSLATDKETVCYLETPAIVLARTGEGIQVSWSEVTGAESYQIYRMSAGEDSYTLVGTTTETLWTDTTASDISDNAYRVCACAGTSVGVGSLLGVTNTASGVQLTWETVDEADEYYISYKASTASYYYTSSVTAESGSTQSKTLSLTSGTTYAIYVRALCSGSFSRIAGTATILYLAQPEVVLSGSGSGNTVSWDAVTSAETYEVYRKTADSVWSVIGTTADTSYTDTTAEDGTIYYYTVQAVSGTYRSSFDEDGVMTGATVTATINALEDDATVLFLLYPTDMTDAEIRAELAGGSTAGAIATVTGTNSGAQSVPFTQTGSYKLVIAASDSRYVARIVTVTLDGSEIALGDLTLNLLGDVNGDGEVTARDATAAYSYATNSSELDDYAAACADADGSGDVTTRDATQIYAHAEGDSSLW